MPAGRARTLAVDGLDVHALEWGPPNAGAAEPGDGEPGPIPTSHPILLVHGLGANAMSWESVGSRLATRLGVTVTAIDLAGFGLTGGPGRNATMPKNRRLVTAVLQELGPAVVVGNSMGGSIAIAVAARRPELVEALVLIDPALPRTQIGGGDWRRAARFAPVLVPYVGRRLLERRARQLGPERIVDSSLGWSLHDPGRLDPDLRLRLVALTEQRHASPEAVIAYATAARSVLAYATFGERRDLPIAARRHPILLLHGEHDQLVPLGAAQDAALAHPGIDLVVLDDLGHAPQLEDPERVVDVMADWLPAVMFA